MEDKKDCFARINENLCNALLEKKCKDCSFYRHKDEAEDYKPILEKGKKELLKKTKKSKRG